jgi:CheY-like chemotaxis protein
MDSLIQRNNNINKGRKRRCGMRETEKDAKKSASSNSGPEISRRILVAEDNKAIQKVVSRILDFMGFEVALAENGVEALSVFLKNSFDLVLTDLEMPIMDGWRLTYRIKERSPNTPVVLMTGADRESVLEKVKSEPIDSVIFKPFSLNDFQSTVQRVLEPRSGEEGVMRALQRPPTGETLAQAEPGKEAA